MHFLRDLSYIISIIISLYFWYYFIITKGDWWMGMGALGFPNGFLIRDKFFSITKNKDNNETRN